ncbi:hypothetical protein MNBD_GAMMA17-590 [hydrothermal vent metagenome]|uniref:DUF3347 domain-containing protein n=1 Tax=hydrothermal vent metagenome TaxID=652676 RepID=A0A3B1A1F7_9ZZZZ
MKNLLKQNSKALLLLTLALVPLSQGYAHPGHADTVTISRSTHVYLQKMVPHYLKIQKSLAIGELNAETRGAAEAIQRLIKKARKKEKDPSGKRMYKGVVKTAGFIGAASSIEAAREEFAELNDILLPFFDNWPNHILEHDLVLYTCKETKQWWLQPNGDKVADPYRGASVACADLTEKEE